MDNKEKEAMQFSQFSDPDGSEQRRKKARKNAKKQKRGRAGKFLLSFLGIAVLVFAVFIVTVKLFQPDADISQFLPVPPREKVVQFINEKLGMAPETTTQPTTQPTTAAPATTRPAEENDDDDGDDTELYIPAEEFGLKAAAQGNQLGNLLAGGKVATDMSYVYHIADGRGIYRFAPSSEGYFRILKTEDTLSSLNLRGGYVYYVNEKKHTLNRITTAGSKPEQLAKDVSFALVYDKEVDYVTTEGAIMYMSTQKLKPVTAYDGETADEVTLIGISQKAVFFTLTASDGSVRYMTAPKKGGEAVPFRPESAEGEIEAPVMENGFFYYYEKQSGGDYNLCRKKIGAQKAVTLVKKVTSLNPPIVENNRLFFGELDGKRFRMKELNMNSDAVKTMLSVNGATADNRLMIQHGGEYDFIIGKKNESDKVYAASSMYTGSANVMRFEDGSWSY